MLWQLPLQLTSKILNINMEDELIFCSECGAVLLEDEVCPRCGRCGDCCGCYGDPDEVTLPDEEELEDEITKI